MKICLVGDISGVLDEGAKNTTFHLAKTLSNKNKVLVVSPRSIVKPSIWLKLKTFTPDVIHYIHGPTWRSFIITNFISLLSSHPVKVMSALRPKITSVQVRWLKVCLPDLLLVQSTRQKNTYECWGFRTHFFPAGVDIRRFNPVSEQNKSVLRLKYDLPEDAYIVLHVGQITHDRELNKLIPIQASGKYQVIVIGARTIPQDNDIIDELERAGCIVRTSFIEHIEEVYQLADVYVFPGSDHSSSEKVPLDAPAIEIPLSVLEAMACNLPVISGHFGGLSNLFNKNNGLVFADTSDEILKQLDRVRKMPEVNTRKQVLQFSWVKLSEELVDIYKGLLKEKDCYMKIGGPEA